MKKIILNIFFIIFILFFGCSRTEEKLKPRKEIIPYVEFLKKEQTRAKDYVLDLFEEKDIVIICERFHPELTQYNLIVDIAKDPRFIKNVGNIFIEVCGRNQEKKIDLLLKSNNLNNKSLDSLTIDIIRNSDFYPLWNNYNFYFLLKELQQINSRLNNNQKINLFPTDLFVDWENMDTLKYKEFWNSIDDRDSLIADFIINKFNIIQKKKRKKILVIMNYRHAFGHKFRYPNHKKPNNVGRFLFDRFQTKVANILLNTLAVDSSNVNKFRAISDGKWDASFKYLNIDNIGFNLNNSPFGADYFDLWPFKTTFTYADVFDGYIYYNSVENFKLVRGIPNIVDSVFLPELKRRNLIANISIGSNYSIVDSLLFECNTKKTYTNFITDSIKVEINKYLINETLQTTKNIVHLADSTKNEYDSNK